MMLARLLTQIAHKHNISEDEIYQPRSRSARIARFEFCFRAAEESAATVDEIRKAVGYKDRSGVYHSVMMWGSITGRVERTVSALRGKERSIIDRARLAYVMAARIDAEGLRQRDVVEMTGVRRQSVAGMLHGQKANADDFIAVCLGLQMDPLSFLTEYGRAIMARAGTD